MTDGRSRHHGLETYTTRPVGTGQNVELFVPRLRKSVVPIRRHQVEGLDRLDLLANFYLGHPNLFWMIADANVEVRLESLIEPGRDIAIPKDAT
jgi:hypothetical protein